MLLVFLFFSFFDFFVLGLYARFMNALYNLLGASSNPQKKKKIVLGLAKNWILDLDFVDLVAIFVNYCI